MDRRVKHAAGTTFMLMSLAAQERDMTAAHLEDQLQEWKMKKIQQEKYELNSTQLLVYQGQKLNRHIEKQLEGDVQVCISLCTFTPYKKHCCSFIYSFAPADAQEEADGGGEISQRAGGLSAKNSDGERRLNVTALFWIPIGQSEGANEFP